MDTSRAATILSHALALFADDGTLTPHGSFAVGTHYRETKTLVLRLKVEPRGGVCLEILQWEDITANKGRIVFGAQFAIREGDFTDDGRLKFKPGPWEAELVPLLNG
jgi:hypothetical protein